MRIVHTVMGDGGSDVVVDSDGDGGEDVVDVIGAVRKCQLLVMVGMRKVILIKK